MKANLNYGKPLLLLIIVVAIITLFSNCSSLLSAKFESDSIGGDPNKTLPGSPSGDEMTYVTEVENQLTILVTPGYPTQKSLEYQSIFPTGSVSPGSGWITFKGKSSNFSKPITFTWTAQKSFSSSAQYMYIDISDGSGILAARLKILANGDLLNVTQIFDGTGDVLGNIPNNQRHTFLVTVNLNSGTFNISVVQPGNDINVQNINVLSQVTSFHNPARPSVSFQYDGYGNSQTYLVDEVLISRKN